MSAEAPTFVEYTYKGPPTIGELGGLHSLVASPVCAIQNQGIRKSSPFTKDSKPLRNERDDAEDLEKTEESRKSPGTRLEGYKNRPRHALHHWGFSGFGRCLFLLVSCRPSS